MYVIKRRRGMYDSHLRSWRERHGWSRTRLAEALGVTIDLIAEWEEGISLPPPAIQAALKQITESADQSIRQVAEANAPSQDGPLAFHLLPHSAPTLDSPLLDTWPLS